jgi:RNA polymerase sigma-70 factor (ECF subfamily)
MPERDGEPRDEVLVVAAILGDLEAFGLLVSRYRAAVVRTARAIVGYDDAEDVAQESLLLAFKALPSIEEPSKFPAWLAAITHHRALRFSRQNRSRALAQVELDSLLLDRIGFLSRPLIEQKAEADELAAAMDRIPGDYAMALRLRFQDEMPLKRIAAYLGLPLSTVKWRLHHGKKLLRKQVELLRT